MTLSRLWRLVLIAAVPCAAALWSAARSEAGSADLWAYREAARYLLAGRDFYHLQDAFPYIYPPLAAILAVPLAVLPWIVTRPLWVVTNVVVLIAVLRHLGVRGMWPLAMTTTAIVTLVFPVSNTLDLGQVGIVIMALVIFDAVEGPRLIRDRARVLPPGVLTGVATGLKLTPGVFIVHYFLTRRYRQGCTALATFAATVLLGIVVTPGPAVGYWLRLAGGDSGVNPDANGWINNISVLSAVYRFTDVTPGGTIIGLGLSALLVLAGLAMALVAYRAGRETLGVSLLGIVSSIANPIAWPHHLTWVVPLLFTVWRDRLAEPLRWAIGMGGLWCLTNPQLRLGGGPWARREIHDFSVGDKVFAAGTDIVVTLMVAVTLWTLWPRPPSTPPHPRPRESESQRVHTDGEIEV